MTLVSLWMEPQTHGTMIYFHLCCELNGGFPKDTLVVQLCLTLCNPWTVWSPPGSSVHGILQARILEWVAIPFSRGASWPRDQTWVSCIAGRFFTFWPIREAPQKIWLKKEKQVIKRWPELVPSFPLNHLVNTLWTRQRLKQDLHSGGDDLTSYLSDERRSLPLFPLKTFMAEQNLWTWFWGNAEPTVSPDHWHPAQSNFPLYQCWPLSRELHSEERVARCGFGNDLALLLGRQIWASIPVFLAWPLCSNFSLLRPSPPYLVFSLCWGTWTLCSVVTPVSFPF